MFGRFNTRRVVWRDGREGIFEVYYNDAGEPLELGPEWQSEETDLTTMSRRARESLAHAMTAPPLLDPDLWPGFPPTNEDDLVEEVEDEVTGVVTTIPIDEETKKWCLEEDARDRAEALERRVTWAPRQEQPPYGNDTRSSEPR